MVQPRKRNDKPWRWHDYYDGGLYASGPLFDSVVGDPEPGLQMTYLGTPGADGGKQYIGVDRFNRVTDVWFGLDTGVVV